MQVLEWKVISSVWLALPFQFVPFTKIMFTLLLFSVIAYQSPCLVGLFHAPSCPSLHTHAVIVLVQCAGILALMVMPCVFGSGSGLGFGLGLGLGLGLGSSPVSPPSQREVTSCWYPFMV